MYTVGASRLRDGHPQRVTVAGRICQRWAKRVAVQANPGASVQSDAGGDVPAGQCHQGQHALASQVFVRPVDPLAVWLAPRAPVLQEAVFVLGQSHHEVI